MGGSPKPCSKEFQPLLRPRKTDPVAKSSRNVKRRAAASLTAAPDRVHLRLGCHDARAGVLQRCPPLSRESERVQGVRQLLNLLLVGAQRVCHAVVIVTLRACRKRDHRIQEKITTMLSHPESVPKAVHDLEPLQGVELRNQRGSDVVLELEHGKDGRRTGRVVALGVGRRLSDLVRGRTVGEPGSRGQVVERDASFPVLVMVEPRHRVREALPGQRDRIGDIVRNRAPSNAPGLVTNTEPLRSLARTCSRLRSLYRNCAGGNDGEGCRDSDNRGAAHHTC